MCRPFLCHDIFYVTRNIICFSRFKTEQRSSSYEYLLLMNEYRRRRRRKKSNIQEGLLTKKQKQAQNIFNISVVFFRNHVDGDENRRLFVPDCYYYYCLDRIHV